MKIRKILVSILLGVFYFIPINIFAAGNISVSTSNINIKKGDTASFTITADNSAGRIDISSSNVNVASVSASSLFLDMQRETITVTANSVGTTTIKVYIPDATTYDDEDLSGKTHVINVTVSEKSTNNISNNLSKNNNIKSISVDGYELVKIDNNKYELAVNSDITSVNINAIAEDSKAKINGVGLHELNIGENNVEIIVTSESGHQNKINVKITRKDGYYLEDLDTLLKDPKLETVSLNIHKDSKISTSDLTKIKSSKKEIKLNYFDENKQLVYSWEIDGKQIDNNNEFLTTILYTSEYIKDISELSNFADGLYVNFKQGRNIPKGFKIKLYVGSKFESNASVNIYNFDIDKKKLNLIQEKMEVKDGYIEFVPGQFSEYFVTMSNIYTTSKESSFAKTLLILLLIELIIINSVAIYFLKIKRSK